MKPPSSEVADEVVRLVKLLIHPSRLRIATGFTVEGPASPSTLAEERFDDLTLADCHHHMGALKDGGALSIAESRKVRGATERIYRINPRSKWPFKPRIYPLIDYLIPTLTSASDPFFIPVRLDLDERGVEDVRAVFSVIRQKAARIETAAKNRLQGTPPATAISAVLIIGLLDAVDFGGAALAEGSSNAPEGRCHSATERRRPKPPPNHAEPTQQPLPHQQRRENESASPEVQALLEERREDEDFLGRLARRLEEDDEVLKILGSGQCRHPAP